MLCYRIGYCKPSKVQNNRSCLKFEPSQSACLWKISLCYASVISQLYTQHIQWTWEYSGWESQRAKWNTPYKAVFQLRVVTFCCCFNPYPLQSSQQILCWFCTALAIQNKLMFQQHFIPKFIFEHFVHTSAQQRIWKVRWNKTNTSWHKYLHLQEHCWPSFVSQDIWSMQHLFPTSSHTV